MDDFDKAERAAALATALIPLVTQLVQFAVALRGNAPIAPHLDAAKPHLEAAHQVLEDAGQVAH